MSIQDVNTVSKPASRDIESRIAESLEKHQGEQQTAPQIDSGYIETGDHTTIGEVSAKISADDMANKSDDDLFNHVLSLYGVNPDEYMIAGNVRISRWEVPGHGDMFSYRANIQKRADAQLDVDGLVDNILADDYTHYIPDAPATDDKWMVIQVGDTHFGKSEDDGAGSELLITRFKECISQALEDAPTHGVHLALMGDMIEGVVSQNGKNVPQLDLSLNEQLDVAQRMVIWAIREALKVAHNVSVSIVPGNHGDTTRAYNARMDNNYDLMIVKNVEQAFRLIDDVAPDSGFNDRLSFHYPDDTRGWVDFTVGDTRITSVHGHKLSKGNTPINKAKEWVKGHYANETWVIKPDIVLIGHYHNTELSQILPNTWLSVAPALESESTYFRELTGTKGTPGVVAFTVDGSHGIKNYTLIEPTV